MACNAGIHRLITGPDDVIIDYGRQTRSIRWANDANTDLDDLVLLCWYHHHHLLHEQHWSLEPHGAGHFVLRDTNGAIWPLRPPTIGLALPAPRPLPFDAA